MKLTFYALQIAAVLFFGSVASASYITAEIDSAHAVDGLGSQVIIAGQGLEKGSIWLSIAESQAMIYRDRAPHGHILLLTASTAADKAKYLDLLTQWQWENIQYTEATFTSKVMSDLLVAQPLIRTIDFVGHNGAFLGMALEDEGPGDHRFYVADVDALAGRLKFSKDAFIRLSGCNTGWYLAPEMAKMWNVPAQGSLTTMDIEYLTVNQEWYFDMKGFWPLDPRSTSTKAIPMKFASENAISYTQPESCAVGSAGCIRLRAVNTSYVGQHGYYTGALPFLKTFCGTVEFDECKRRMALSTLTLIGMNPMGSSSDQLPTAAQYKQILMDQFCAPDDRKHEPNRKACLKKVAEHIAGVKRLDSSFTTMRDWVPVMDCDFQTCQFHQINNPKTGKLMLENVGPARTDTLVNELDAYLSGYEILKANP